ncbi:hypothetical protein [Nocardia asteroides]|uniref:hypothetical protein n=1 Tax=Nocardia asteroides TaxID=1824 RepID=UPI003F549EFF
MATEVTLSGDALELPGGVRITFIRTLRLPETGTYPLPPGLGVFPLRRVADYPDTVPEEWRRRGGVMLPVYQREAMWLRFSAAAPVALKVGVGKVCAVSGKPWSDELAQDPQNYLTLPEQPWMDGINSGDGTVRQFVAVPLGLGETVEGQVTGTEQWAVCNWPSTDSPTSPATSGTWPNKPASGELARSRPPRPGPARTRPTARHFP